MADLSRHERASFWVAVAAVLSVLSAGPFFAGIAGKPAAFDPWHSGLVQFALGLWTLAVLCLLWAMVLKIRTPNIGFQAPVFRREDRGLKIVNAQYGADAGAWKDVTSTVRQRVTKGVLDLFVGNEVFGDPCFGIPKVLKVNYTIDGKEQAGVYNELAHVVIPQGGTGA